MIVFFASWSVPKGFVMFPCLVEQYASTFWFNQSARAQCVTNIEFSNQYEYEYIRDVNFGMNMNKNIFVC